MYLVTLDKLKASCWMWVTQFWCEIKILEAQIEMSSTFFTLNTIYMVSGIYKIIPFHEIMPFKDRKVT